ncbi:MAG: hypothetical protein A3H98_09510 [Bacteroidetes bacterium RIFCSPLOWO2_02_FULL_36_8]|nr:MAG: hypothetical protein A3H98_09510 [Bacteroidetes bacterium RIFCSPLOWO2_02_FULL_36_8]OFY71911.1 MAG: hypothetical protein A3G23_05150 [Bacteroidetes bacterium RIFCSPLOWO2_12_FULL_37_12]
MLLPITLLFVSTFLTGILVLNFPQKKNLVPILLSFSGAYLFTLTILDLLPTLYLKNPSFKEIGYFVLTGFFLQVVLERFSTGVEHGHVHFEDQEKYSDKIPFGIFISLSIHAFLEGVPLLKLDSNNEITIHYGMLAGIITHKIPESFALISILTFIIRRNRTIVLLLIIYSVITPAGMYLEKYLYLSQTQTIPFFTYLMALVCGALIHVSTTILFESGTNHKVMIKKLLAIAGGVMLGILL